MGNKIVIIFFGRSHSPSWYHADILFTIVAGEHNTGMNREDMTRTLDSGVVTCTTVTLRALLNVAVERYDADWAETGAPLCSGKQSPWFPMLLRHRRGPRLLWGRESRPHPRPSILCC